MEGLVLRGLSAGTGLRKYTPQSLGLSGLFTRERAGEKFIVKKGNLVDARTSQGSSLVTKSLKFLQPIKKTLSFGGWARWMSGDFRV